MASKLIRDVIAYTRRKPSPTRLAFSCEYVRLTLHAGQIDYGQTWGRYARPVSLIVDISNVHPDLLIVDQHGLGAQVYSRRGERKPTVTNRV